MGRAGSVKEGMRRRCPRANLRQNALHAKPPLLSCGVKTGATGQNQDGISEVADSIPACSTNHAAAGTVSAGARGYTMACGVLNEHRLNSDPLRCLSRWEAPSR